MVEQGIKNETFQPSCAISLALANLPDVHILGLYQPAVGSTEGVLFIGVLVILADSRHNIKRRLHKYSHFPLISTLQKSKHQRWQLCLSAWSWRPDMYKTKTKWWRKVRNTIAAALMTIENGEKWGRPACTSTPSASPRLTSPHLSPDAAIPPNAHVPKTLLLPRITSQTEKKGLQGLPLFGKHWGTRIRNCK